MVLALMCGQVYAAHALSVSYGQQHPCELDAAANIARIPDLPGMWMSNASQTVTEIFPAMQRFQETR